MPRLSDEEILRRARAIARARLASHPLKVTAPRLAGDYLITHYAQHEHEEFSCLWLDNRHNLIAHETLFRGTLDSASVYPREVVKAALAHNAAAVVVAHNHPSGDPDPSDADKHLTDRLKAALGTVDIRVLDHIVVGGDTFISFAEKGYL